MRRRSPGGVTSPASLSDHREILPRSPHARRLHAILDDPLTNLDQLAATIESGIDPHAPPAPASLRALDDLARRWTGPGPATGPEVMEHVYGALGFAPNVERYYALANSMLSQVLETRRGIPLTLAIVGICIGRRLGVELVPVGMPAHFLIGQADRAGAEPSRWFDPFGGGRELDAAGAAAIFDSLTPPTSEFSPTMLIATPLPFVAARMVANIRNAASRSGDLAAFTAASELLIGLPGAGVAECRQLAPVLAAAGRHERATEVYRWLAATDDAHSEQHARRAARHAAHSN